MRKYNPGIIPVMLSVLFLFSVSCSSLTCYEETEALLKASFNNYTTLAADAPDSLTLHGLNMDSLLYSKAAAIQPAKFPLNPATDTCAFIIRINGVTDTIIFRYSSYPHYVSKECGYTFNHELDSTPVHTKNNIDSISLIKSKITTANEENIRIFY